MSKILIVNSSPQRERSVSRRLTALFQQHWEQVNSGPTIVSRDLAAHSVPPVTEAWLAGAFAPPEAHTPDAKAAIAVSDELVNELLWADRYVFGVPTHNFTIPSTFKSYIDQVVRVGRTFGIGSAGPEGLVKGKKAIFVISSGWGLQTGTPGAAFQEPYLRAIWGFIGVTDIQFVVADGQSMGEAAAQESIAKAEAALKKLATSW